MCTVLSARTAIAATSAAGILCWVIDQDCECNRDSDSQVQLDRHVR